MPRRYLGGIPPGEIEPHDGGDPCSDRVENAGRNPELFIIGELTGVKTWGESNYIEDGEFHPTLACESVTGEEKKYH
jgi:hypothetical protein